MPPPSGSAELSDLAATVVIVVTGMVDTEVVGPALERTPVSRPDDGWLGPRLR